MLEALSALKPLKKTAVIIKLTIVNALSGNEFIHKFTLKEDATIRTLMSENKFKQIQASFEKRTASGDRIFYAKEQYVSGQGSIFDKQDVYNSAASDLTEATKPVIENIKKEGEKLAKASVEAVKKTATASKKKAVAVNKGAK